MPIIEIMSWVVCGRERVWGRSAQRESSVCLSGMKRGKSTFWLFFCFSRQSVHNSFQMEPSVNLYAHKKLMVTDLDCFSFFFFLF